MREAIADSVQVDDAPENAWVTRYVVIGDTGQFYDPLDEKMYKLSAALGIEIDTMNRSYNKAKNLIALADNDEDEIYRGDYFPRRFGDNQLSLEYLTVYLNSSREHTIALVAGIRDNKASADSMAYILKQYAPGTFVLETDIYMGCLH